MTKDEALDRKAENARELGLNYEPEQEPVAWEGGEGWESLAWELCANENGEDSCNELIWEGGPIPEPWGDRWMKYEEEAKRLIALVQKHTTPPQRKEPEPVVWMYQDKSTHEVRFQKHMRGFVDHGATYETPLYTTAPQLTWVGLTDEEANELWESTDIGDDWELMKRTEAKLKEKNT